MRVQKRVQSRAYAPPQGPPTRSPPITRDATIPLVAAHTLTRMGGPKPPRHGPSLHTAKTVMKPITLASSRLPFFSTHLNRRRPARRRPRAVSNTRRHARGSSGDRVSGALLQEISTATRAWATGCAGTLAAGVWMTVRSLVTPELRPGPGPRDMNALADRPHSTTASTGRRAWSQAGST